MSKQRFSKLQKWILIEAYNLEKDFYKREIYTKFFNIKLGHYEHWKYVSSQLNNSIAVIVSRSIRRLKEKGLIDWPRHYKGICHLDDSIRLTEKGIEIALMLISMERER